ncbi:cobalt/nickel transport system permease protein [Thermanaeromonas toyohensis ToBE]|uniref:Cobalt/nickel transport system permease protein n=1 Tax=Thermanaeromonas toyohensis ToBE TaxID=698762 RepID=A0A1W1W058_9FIRM|nr:energy-coupling factor ABC transporter permease [Thermanaeromonas toyohensis]SMB98999.1 cobalt/nickel transport system permease protein [Thermanaeromonas toyohensis ToBE]
MSHLHIPDGVIPPVWLVLGFVGAAILLALAIVRTRREDINNKLPRLSVICAFMLLAMSVPLGFLPTHLNLTVLAGILLGPWLGIIAVFVVNLILALLGHGGITVVGLNTLVVGSEAILGYHLFKALYQRLCPVIAVATATALALLFSMSLMIAVVGLTQVEPAIGLHHQHNNHHLSLEEGHEVEPPGEISLVRFAHIVLPIGLVGIILETTVTSLLVSYLWKVKPDLIDIVNNKEGRTEGKEGLTR